MSDELLMEKLHAAGAHVTVPEASRCGCHMEVRVAMAALETAAAVLRDAGLYPVFMTAVHADPHCELNYQFAAWDRHHRVLLSATADSENRARSLTPLFAGLRWPEREARDMFGIIFEGHPDLRPLLLCDEDRDLHPLRKNPQRLKTLQQLSPAGQSDAGTEAP